MSFRLLPNSVTLDDLEQRNNSPNRSVISPNSVAFGTDYRLRKSGWITNTFSSRNVGQRI